MPIAMFRDSSCSVARSLSLLGERWTLLVIREALAGVTRFETFRENLGVGPDVLSERLSTLVEHGIMRREAYQEPGRRARDEYFLTDVGRELHVVVGALQQWGDDHLPRPEGPSVIRRSLETAAPVRVAFVDVGGREVPHEQVAIIHT
jgi:DNA-binding HxlR family transcriptional regulator